MYRIVFGKKEKCVQCDAVARVLNRNPEILPLVTPVDLTTEQGARTFEIGKGEYGFQQAPIVLLVKSESPVDVETLSSSDVVAAFAGYRPDLLNDFIAKVHQGTLVAA